MQTFLSSQTCRLVLAIATLFTSQISVSAKAGEEKLNLLVSIDDDAGYWVGPVAEWQGDQNNKMTLGFSTSVTNGKFLSPGTLVLDVPGSVPEEIQDFGNPLETVTNTVRIFYQNGVLIAHDRKGTKNPKCKTDPISEWQDCLFDTGKLSKNFQPHFKNGAMEYLGTGKIIPMLVSRNRLVKLDSKSGILLDCNIKTGACDEVTLRNNTGRIAVIYTYFVRNKILYFFANSGDFGHYDLTRKKARIFIANKYPNGGKISNQFYTSFSRSDDVLLGHYPTGDVYRFYPKTGALQPWSSQKPSTPEMLPPAPELQSIGYANGLYWAGLWPFGEVYYGREDDKGLLRWSRFKRLFSTPETETGKRPFEDQMKTIRDKGFNQWGQRVDTIANCFSGLCITTSNKTGILVSDERNLISVDTEKQYGRIYYMPSNKLICHFQPQNGQMHLAITITESEVSISDGQSEICRSKNSSLAKKAFEIARKSVLQLGSGMLSGNGSFVQQIQRPSP